MREKLTIEQFRNIKNQLNNLIEEYENIEEENKDNKNFNKEAIENEFTTKYIEIEKKLVSYDLSDIPFEEWKDIIILSDENNKIDFSKTNANIDFDIVDCYCSCNFHGCNVKNLDKLGRHLYNQEFDEKTINDNSKFFISDIFDDDFKEKFYHGYLEIKDFVNLNDSQLEELKTKNLKRHFLDNDFKLIDLLGIEKIISFYKESSDDYKIIIEILTKLTQSIRYSLDPFSQDDMYNEIKNTTSLSEIKSILYKYLKEKISHDRYFDLDIKELPELFVEENPNFFLLDKDIDDELRKRYYSRKLTIDDIINNPELFDNINIDNFVNSVCHDFVRAFGPGNFQKALKLNPDIIKYIINTNDRFFLNDFEFSEKDENISFEEFFKEKVKKNFDGSILRTKTELMNYKKGLFILESDQQRVIDLLGIEFIQKFEEEYKFFSHKEKSYGYIDDSIPFFDKLTDSFAYWGNNIKESPKTYEEFCSIMADFIIALRKRRIFSNNNNYDFIQGKFRDEHPELFIDKDAPEELKNLFYENSIYPEDIQTHPEYIQYLLDKNLSYVLNTDIELSYVGLVDDKSGGLVTQTDFAQIYIQKYGNEKFLNLCKKYGSCLNGLGVSSFHGEIDNEELIEKKIRESIYNRIINHYDGDYHDLAQIPEFVEEYPEIFIDLTSLDISSSEKEQIEKLFYTGNLTKDYIRRYPQLIPKLKDKNLFVAFNYTKYKTEFEILSKITNEEFLELCLKYGDYFGKQGEYDCTNLETITKDIEKNIYTLCRGGIQSYDENAPDFLKEEHPELFLDENAPEELKKYFYNRGNNYPLTFRVLQQHKEWLPYLNGKDVIASLRKQTFTRNYINFYVKLFGEEKAIKLGINRAETVTEMLTSQSKVTLMKNWYDKTGGKFIPDYVVMTNFPIEEADKFLTSGSNWSNLMKIQSFAESNESRDAMLKLAYSFGAFDQDQRGFKKLQDLLTNIPKKIDKEYDYIIERIDASINHYSGRKIFCTEVNNDKSFEQMLNYASESSFDAFWTEEQLNKYVDNLSLTSAQKEEFKREWHREVPELLGDLSEFIKSLKSEKIDIDFSKDIFSQLYKKNEDGSYVLTINQQSCPKTVQFMRNILEEYRELSIISPDKAHQLFGGFELRYDPDFRDFLLQNLDKILDNSEYTSFISNIQKQFAEIKTFNSNRHLTLELAISYVQTNKYTSVNTGNERVAEVSAIAGYSQSDFNTLQQIYNYGKQRTFSSIPRIEKTSGKYHYEILKLDDPLAMAIGTLSDCCQELGNCAEVCMEHSMVDKNGRVFVVKDEEDKVVAQSWVWRNKDVICFDNIEIPDKAFDRAVKEYPELGRKGLTDDVYDIYKQAAHELIEADEKKFKNLLDSKKITEEQYEGLRLGKVTVGLGYNDIAESLKKNSTVDRGNISRPLSFKEPVELDRTLYTRDSTTQYILEEREDRKEYTGETLPVHSDTYIEYDDSNFKDKYLLSLEKLEMLTKDNPRYLDTDVGSSKEEGHIVSEIAYNYDLNPQTTKIIMHPNFSIIYDINDNKLRIGDLLFNTKIDNGEQQMDIEDVVTMQIRLALDQIGNNKEIDISALDEKQKEMYEKAMNLNEELDIERGIGHAR